MWPHRIDSLKNQAAVQVGGEQRLPLSFRVFTVWATDYFMKSGFLLGFFSHHNVFL